ncbi:hypothetical protein [Streptomyces sp. NPDC087297]|uniref:hypothetical protein n=1 Tax=Streptomyces sp. NPDC087297 TaxID=3365778 RepID=UPI00382A241B
MFFTLKDEPAPVPAGRVARFPTLCGAWVDVFNVAQGEGEGVVRWQCGGCNASAQTATGVDRFDAIRRMENVAMGHADKCSKEQPLTVPATGAQVQVLERLTLAARTVRGAQQYLAELYQRVGAALTLAEAASAEEVVVPLLQADLERLQKVVADLGVTAEYLSHRPGARRDSECGQQLLRELYMGLGRAKVLRALDGLAVYEQPGIRPRPEITS